MLSGRREETREERGSERDSDTNKLTEWYPYANWGIKKQGGRDN